MTAPQGDAIAGTLEAPGTVTEIRLRRLSLKSFKGARDFSLETRGADVTIYGDNASGKTSLADAFSWLLFGKDSQGRADFELKTLDQSGEAVHGLDHEVAAVLDVDGRPLELRKVYREKWQKRRGSADREFTGHTTDHFVDGVPVKEKEYQAAVGELADEAVMRLLTDPVHFPERIHWQERRRILLDVCGDVSDDDVMVASRELQDLPEILAGRSIDDHRKVAQSKKKTINAELQRVPVRIDEVSRGLPSVPAGLEAGDLRARLAELREHRAEAEARRERIASGGEIAEKTKRLRELEGELLQEQNRDRQRSAVATDAIRKRLAGAQAELDAATREASRLTREIEAAKEEIAQLGLRMGDRRGEWHLLDEYSFAPAVGEVCAACGQRLPAERVAEAKEKALATFNADKSRRLEELVSEGKRLRARRDVLATENERRHKALEAAEARAKERGAEVEAIEKELDSATGTLRVEPSDREQLLVAAKGRVEDEIRALAQNNLSALEECDAERQQQDDRIAGIESELSRVEQRRSAEKRVEELRKEERRLAAEYEQLEREIYLLEEFTRRKVSLLTDRINGRFALARFRLFEEQLNGSLSEVCDVSYDGVPWGSLNHGARIQVGLDVIRTLQQHYGVAPSIWVDQSESVTRLPKMDSQVIRLVVSEQDKTLRVEA